MFCTFSNRYDLLVCRRRSFLLATMWLIGLSVGVRIGLSFSKLLLFEAGVPVFLRMSLPVTVFLLLVPFLFALTRIPLIIYIVVFLDALAQGSVLKFFIVSSPISGWLLTAILFFSKFSTAFLQFYFCRQCLIGESRVIYKSFCACVAILLLIVIFDYLVVAPLLSVH